MAKAVTVANPIGAGIMTLIEVGTVLWTIAQFFSEDDWEEFFIGIGQWVADIGD